MNTNPLGSPIPLRPPTLATASAPSAPPFVEAGENPSFKDLLLQSIGEVNGMQQDAQRAVEQLVTGGEVNMAEVMTTVQKADMSLRMMLQMRNKLVQAYEEIKDIRI
jgi:flagellar hook-basal body complex protein FliE